MNPVVLRLDVKGGSRALLAAVLVFGAVQLTKEYGAEACREQYADIADHQTDMLTKIARLQGRWTPELKDSHRVVVEAARVGAAGCGSLLSGLGFRIRIPRGPEFDVRLDGPGMVGPVPHR